MCYTITMKESINLSLAVIAEFLIFVFGGFDIALKVLLLAIILDYLSGIVKAFVLGEADSKQGFKGIVKKVSILLIVALSVQIDLLTNAQGLLRTLVIYYFVANEGLSIIENLASAGVPIPNVLKQALKQLRKESKNVSTSKKVRSSKNGKA